jgi:hypothetical protein
MDIPGGWNCTGNTSVPSQYLTPTGTPNADYIMLWTARPTSGINNTLIRHSPINIHLLTIHLLTIHLLVIHLLTIHLLTY